VAPSDPKVIWVGTGEANDRNSSSWGNGVYRSTDGGATWLPQSSPPTNLLWDLDCATPTTCLIAGRGQILGTTNGGANWSLQNAGTNNDLVGIDCPGSTACFAVGYSGTILALPTGPPPPWWTQPAQPLAVPAPPGPWYLNGVKPPTATPASTHAAPWTQSTHLTPSPSGSPLPAPTQAKVSRALASLVEQIASALPSLFPSPAVRGTVGLGRPD